VACKSDWLVDEVDISKGAIVKYPEGIITPEESHRRAKQAGSGLIEVTTTSSVGKKRMRNVFIWMIKTFKRVRRE